MKTLQSSPAPSAETMSVAAAKAFALDDRKVIERSGNEERAALITTVGALRRLHDALDLCAVFVPGRAAEAAIQTNPEG